MLHLNHPVPTLLLWGLSTVTFLLIGLRLSSVPIALPSAPTSK
jgi:hypothetical protein